MSNRPPKALKAIAAFLVFAIGQIGIQIGFAEPNSAGTSLTLPQNIIVARLTTTNNQPILVNGSSAASGATLLTGAEVTTPAAVGATINLGELGTIDMAPNTTIRIEFDDDGKLRVTLVSGCVIVNAKKKTEGEIVLPDGTTATKSDREKGGVMDVCFPPGAAGPTVGQGAAAAAGAGAGGGAAGGAAAAGGLSTAAKIAIFSGIGGAAFGLPLAFRGHNPSPSN